MRKLLTTIACLMLVISTAVAQTGIEASSPTVINYTPKEYGGDGTNWTVTGDEKGRLYVGNDFGLLEYDGTEWRIYPLPNKSTIRSLAAGDRGKIYAGAQGDLGYFQPNAAGRLTFYSLLNYIPEANRDFSDVWQTYIANGKVYFNSQNYLFTWDIQKQRFSSIPSKNNFHIMFLVDGRIYIREWSKGLEVLENDSLPLVKGGEQFANERIYVMLPFPGKPGTMLIGTRTMGLFKYNGQNFIPFKTEADEFIKTNLIYSPGAILRDGTILLGTLSGGAIVIDTAGKLLHRYNTEAGIINNKIYFAFRDKAGAAWLATDNGISWVDASSPITYFDKRNNYNTAAYDIVRYRGILYSAGDDGVYFLNPQTNAFELLKNSNTQCFQFLNTGNELLVATYNGLFKVEKHQLIPVRKTVKNEYNALVLKCSASDTNRVYVATSSGLWSVRRKNNSWTDEGQVAAINDQATSIVEDEDGSIWVSSRASGLYRIKLRKDNRGNIILKGPAPEHFDQKNGLQNTSIYAYKINKIDYFITEDSIYRFNENRKLFYADTSDKLIADVYRLIQNYSLTRFLPDSLGRIWLQTNGRLYMGSFLPGNSLVWVSAPFNEFADEIINTVYTEKNGTTWLGKGLMIAHYDFNKKNSRNTAFAALVRQVTIGEDSTIFFGNRPGKLAIPQITYQNNSVKFRYAATSYEAKNSNRFKAMLEGFDKDWPAWSNETVKEYTNLPPGKYTFKVKAINLFDTESSVDSYSFEILPPWYRTWWAYGCCTLLFVLLSFGLYRWQRSRLIAKERQGSEARAAKVKAEADSERLRNMELISEIGKEITSSLSVAHIIDTVYAHVNKLMDAQVFGIGIYNREKLRLDFPVTRQKGQALPPYNYALDDDTLPAGWCFNNAREIFINDFERERQAHTSDIPEAMEGANTESLIYLPLIYKDKPIGVITAQSFSKNAYTQYHLNILRSLASYTALALDNADAYRSLESTQAQLIQSEKMASLGELTAGIAHEIQNPLNFVNNFSDVNKELLEELKEEADKGNIDEVKAIANNVIDNEEKINHHGKRADAIVRGMLQHSRQTKGVKEPTDVNALCDEYLRLSYHGLRAKDKNFNADYKTDFNKIISKVSLVPQDMGRVLLNLFNNAFYAVSEKKKIADETYKPTVLVQTKKINNTIEITVADNGNGIPQNIIDKIFQPFFTTKPTGQGTGLGLSLAYDIITKEHNGTIKVESKEGEGSVFTIQLPNT